VFVFGLWNWPQVDQRFLGRWSLAANGDPAGPFCIYEFHGNGVLQILHPGEMPYACAWSGAGDDGLLISSRIPAPLLPLYLRLPQRLRGRPSADTLERLYLSDIKPDHFRMGYSREFDDDYHFTRIPE